MKKLNQILYLVASAYLVPFTLFARENIGQAPKQASQHQINSAKISAACSQSGSQIDLDLNNVRTKILGGGDMWWDLKNVKYEIPKDSRKHSLFAGSLWIGGYDQGGTLKIAAMTYRQTGNDFWPGPLDVSNASADASICANYDKHFVITKKEVQEFDANFTTPIPGYSVPESITNWPGTDRFGNTSITQNLAPYYDRDLDGSYNPELGDYPGFSLRGEMGDCKAEAQLFGDRALWWVFNDKGNVHTESDGAQVGLEIHAQAFAFNTNDDINNMTFYQYQIFNRSTDRLDSCYLGMWVDPDLGNPDDDYIGCDVQRGLGFCYNGDADDNGNGENHYGLNPPAIGIDYFQGPLADPDGIANPPSATFNGTGYNDTIKDNERLGMEKFMFYKNDFSLEGNPQTTQHFYNYLNGKWKDGNRITYGGTGHLTPGAPFCNFMFPWDTDPNNATPWYAGSVADGRFIHSSGVFTLKPGAVNIVTVGAVWAQATSGGPTASVNLMKAADDKAQRLFDNCFQVLNGPDAPDLTIRELDKELIIYLSNKKNSNNYQDKYSEIDPSIASPQGQFPRYDSIYRFQGYQIFQMKSASASVADINNADLARLVAQCDVKDGVAQLVNFKFDPALNANVPTQEVFGADAGLIKSFRIKEDAFATGAKSLVNHKAYYFLALSYGYNNYKTYDQGIPESFDGQKSPYKAGRNNVGKGGKPYVGIPHIVAPENYGTVINSEFGQQPKITRIEGQGNGGFALNMTAASESAILADPNFKRVEYEAGEGPVNVKIIDPLRVPSATFTLKLIPAGYTQNGIDKGRWTLQNNNTGATINSDTTFDVSSEQIFPEWGISVTISQSYDPGNANAVKNGYISSSMVFSDPSKVWLSGIPDIDAGGAINWIRSGTSFNPQPGGDVLSDDYAGIDPNSDFERILPVQVPGTNLSGGSWAPYRLCSKVAMAFIPNQLAPLVKAGFAGPAWDNPTIMASPTNFQNLASVDIVITADQSKWTRCAVFETNDDSAAYSSSQPTRKFDLRNAASVGKDGQPDASGTRGMGWFPGYAINIETGERLNMAFGEDSHFDGANSPINENGADMIWNPTSNADPDNIFGGPGGQGLIDKDKWSPSFAGRHYVYVFNHNLTANEKLLTVDTSNVPAYDSCNFVYNKMRLKNFHPTDGIKRAVFKDIIWAGIPLKVGNQPLLACDVRIKLRVTKPYENNYAGSGYVSNAVMSLDGPRANPAQNNNYPMYSFSTAVFAPKTYDKETAQNALQLINVVPNPYYGYSAYESNQVDNEIKFTNLPQRCTIKIYTMNGSLVREFNKDDAVTSLNWDLKNQLNIPIASGAYLIHVDVPGVGEKVVKWFGALRPLDLDTY